MLKATYYKYLFFVLLVACAKANAQPFKSIFGAQSTVWNVHCFDIDFPYPASFFALKDTIIGPYTYKKVSISDKPYVPFGFLYREDLQAGKVWVKGMGYCQAPEEVFMDYTLKLGDTFKLSPMAGFSDTDFVVDSVYVWNNRKHIRFAKMWGTMAAGPYLQHKLEFIEGIGTNFGLDFHFRSNTGLCNLPCPNIGMMCVQQDGVKVWGNPDFNEDCFYYGFTASVSKRRHGLYKISPNPVLDKLIIEQAQNCSLSIYDITGRQVIYKARCADKETIDLSDFHQGVYFIKVTNEDGIASINKINKL